MPSKPLHVVIWLPATFYSAVAATLVEMLELVNAIRRSQAFSFEFVSRARQATSTSGISFGVKARPSKPMDVLILLAMPGLEIPQLLRSLEEEGRKAAPLIATARRQHAVIAAHCSASYFLARAGLIDGKRATISWWLKAEAQKHFPRVRWDPTQLLIRQDRVYTCGGGFSGLELARALLKDLGFEREERLVRNLLVLPPTRRVQTPYEMPLEEASQAAQSFTDKLTVLSKGNLPVLSLDFLSKRLGLSPRTLARRFADEMLTSPGRWIQNLRLESARQMLERTRLSISEICYRVGYQDVASFGRLFSRLTGLPPGEYRRQAR